jgi:periplasmic protein TonB
MNAPTFPHAPLPAGRPAWPQPGRTRRDDGLTATQRRLMVAVIVAAHAAGAWGLMQLSAVRQAVLQAAPMLVSLITPPTPTPEPTPPLPRPVQKKPPPPTPLITAAPSPEPDTFVVPAPPPVEAPQAVAVPVAAAASAAPVPAAPPRLIPASAVQYLEPPVLVYPRLSARNGERGRAMVRVFIDTEGLPQAVQVGASSGFARLDEAAVSAVRKARFKPYTENGQPAAGWAVVPANFE